MFNYICMIQHSSFLTQQLRWPCEIKHGKVSNASHVSQSYVHNFFSRSPYPKNVSPDEFIKMQKSILWLIMLNFLGL